MYRVVYYRMNTQVNATPGLNFWGMFFHKKGATSNQKRWLRKGFVEVFPY